MKEPISFPDAKIETLFKVEPPLEELKNGFGYKGVILRNIEEDTLQCHICGVWRKGLSTHIVKAHKILTEDYKKEFGLPLSFPLVSKSTSAKHSKRASSEKSLENLRKYRNPTKASHSRPRWKMKYFRNNHAFHNMKGACKEQIERRFLIVADIVGKEPSIKDLDKYDKSLHGIIRRRYKTINKFRKKFGYCIRKKAKIFSDDELIAFLRKEYTKTNELPRANTYRKGSPNTETIKNHFGSWRRALVIAGLI